jgi:hypothetical protein
MKTVMIILHQLFWGVTAGALSAAAGVIIKGVLVGGVCSGAGWLGLRHWKQRKARRS